MTTAIHKHKDDVREHILATGQRIMAAKGYSAVGLNEILTEAGVPKGSFYHYFGSKDAFAVAMLESYFAAYLDELERTLAQPEHNMAQRLMNYWQQWQATQSFQDCQGKCLAVKLGAEVADLSENLRRALEKGTSQIVARLAEALETGAQEGSLSFSDGPRQVAESLYQLWLGASVMVKIVRNRDPFASAMLLTRQTLGIAC